MTTFGQQLAQFEIWIGRNEPALAPEVSAIIDRHYRSKGFSGLGDAVDDLLNDPAAQSNSTAALSTTDAIASFFNAAANQMNSQARSAQQLQQLQVAAQTQAAQSAGNKNTGLLLAGLAAVGAVLLLARR